MKKLFGVIAVVCLALAAHAQNLTTVTATNIQKGGVPLSSGMICFTGTDSNNLAIGFQVGGGGQEVIAPYCQQITNGALAGSLQVANPAHTAPANINYRIEISDQFNLVLRYIEVQFTGATFNFDTYVPSANLPLGTSANVATIGTLTVTGSCTGCGGGSSIPIETNGTNNSSQSLLNIQNGTGTTASNPSGGNVQVAVNYGTAANTAAQGNDSRITGALQSSNNLSDLGSASSARTNLGLGSAATVAATAFSGVGACAAHQWASTLNGNAAPSCTQPAFSDISSTVTNAQLHDSYSGVGACASHQWVSTINSDAAPSCTQPSYSDISGTPTLYYQTFQNASGSAMAQEPKVEFTGTAVASVTDDSANGRTIYTLTASAGSGVTLQTNGTNDSSQSALNLQSSAATNGITITETNTSGGNVQLGYSGTLAVGGGGTGQASVPGSNGQLIYNCSGAYCAEDPIVSYNYVNLFNAISATATQTSSAIRVSTFGAYGSLAVTWASITGSPSSCTIQLKSGDSLGNFVNNGSAISVTPSNGTSFQAFSSASTIPTQAQMEAVYACTGYPSAGTLTLDFVPGITVSSLQLPAALDGSGFLKTHEQGTAAISAAALPLPSNAAQETGGNLATIAGAISSSVMQSNTKQVNGVATQTGAGAVGTGSQRVAVGQDTTTIAGSAPGTAGTASSNVISVQGIASMTAVKVDGSAVTQPVSGTVTANAGTGTFTTSDSNLVSQGSTTSGQKGPLVQGAVTTSAPSYTTAQSSPLSLNTSGGLRVDGSGVTQPVSGTVTANAGTGTFNIQSNASVNVNQVAGNSVSTAATGVQKIGISGNSAVALDAAIGATAPANVVAEGLKDTAGNSEAALSDTNGRQFFKPYPDTTTTSYTAASKFAASSTTDNAVLPGNATNTVLVTEVRLTCTQTTAGILNVELLKRSTADTSGTSSNITVVPDDANYAAGVSVPKSYTGTGPTVGTAVGDIDDAQVGCLASATAAPNDMYFYRPVKPIVLRGTAQQLAINLGGAVTGGTITVTFKWSETTTP